MIFFSRFKLKAQKKRMKKQKMLNEPFSERKRNQFKTCSFSTEISSSLLASSSRAISIKWTRKSPCTIIMTVIKTPFTTDNVTSRMCKTKATKEPSTTPSCKNATPETNLNKILLSITCRGVIRKPIIHRQNSLTCLNKAYVEARAHEKSGSLE